MTDERRLKILEDHYQCAYETFLLGLKFNAQSFLFGGFTRAMLIVSILEEMELISQEEAEKRRHYLIKKKNGGIKNE